MSLLRTFTFIALRRSSEPATMDFSGHVVTAVDLEHELDEGLPGPANEPATASTVRLHLHRADGIEVLAPPVVVPRGLLQVLVDAAPCRASSAGDICLEHGHTTSGTRCPQYELKKVLAETERP